MASLHNKTLTLTSGNYSICCLDVRGHRLVFVTPVAAQGGGTMYPYQRTGLGVGMNRKYQRSWLGRILVQGRTPLRPSVPKSGVGRSGVVIQSDTRSDQNAL
jgi:hypothetical protein